MEYLNRMAKKKIANQLTKPTRFTWSHSYTGGFLNKFQFPSKISKIKVPFSISLIKRKNTIRKQIRATKFTLLSNIIRNKFRKVKYALKNKNFLARSISKQRVNPVLRRNAWVSNVKAIILKNIIKKIRAVKKNKKNYLELKNSQIPWRINPSKFPGIIHKRNSMKYNAIRIPKSIKLKNKYFVTTGKRKFYKNTFYKKRLFRFNSIRKYYFSRFKYTVDKKIKKENQFFT